MLSKNEDTFFDEPSVTDNPEQNLLNMVSQFDAAAPQVFKQGTMVKGTIVSIGREYAFVDIGAKSEALLGFGDLTALAPQAKPGDAIEALIISTANGDLMLGRSLSSSSGGAAMADLQSAMQNALPLQGKVTAVNKGGFRVKVMGREAFCPVSQIDLKFVEDPNIYIDQTLSFVITRITEGGRNIVVSRHPLLEIELQKQILALRTDIESKTVKRGAITRIAAFGMFIDCGGVDGMAHISELAWDRVEKIEERFAVGQEVDFVILSIDVREPLRNSRIALSLKQAQGNPWIDIADKFKIGQQAPGRITRLANFGAFVELIPGVEGLIHISEMSWGKRINHPQEVVKEGQPVTVTILKIDEDKHNISCTLKDVLQDPWADVATRFVVGETVQGVVERKAPFGYFMMLGEGITALLPNARIGSENKQLFKTGETVAVTIESVDMGQRKIGLAHGMTEMKEESAVAQEYLQKQAQKKQEPVGASNSVFGEMLKNAMNKNKSK